MRKLEKIFKKMVETETDPETSTSTVSCLFDIPHLLSEHLRGEIIFPGRATKTDMVHSQKHMGRGGAFSCIQLQRAPSIPEEQGSCEHSHQTSSCVFMYVHVCMIAYRGLRWMLGVCHRSFPSHLLRRGLSLTPGWWLTRLAGQRTPGVTMSLCPPIPSACVRVRNTDTHIRRLCGFFTSELRSSLCFKHFIDRTLFPALECLL